MGFFSSSIKVRLFGIVGDWGGKARGFLKLIRVDILHVKCEEGKASHGHEVSWCRGFM